MNGNPEIRTLHLNARQPIDANELAAFVDEALRTQREPRPAVTGEYITPISLACEVRHMLRDFLNFKGIRRKPTESDMQIGFAEYQRRNVQWNIAIGAYAEPPQLKTQGETFK